MTNPATDKTLAEDFASILHTDNRPCVMINDSPGFVAQRVLAQIVNIGSDIAQQGLATTQDIEKAVELGLGYPKGPLSLGDQMGAQYCALILNELYAFYGDPRYRLSPWLKRRALLKLSLLAS
jgi:3-hydroxybutyryl-CoA dehydrogenase